MSRAEKLELDALSDLGGKTRSEVIRQLIHKAATESVERYELLSKVYPHTDVSE
jgi:hypothetical protein